MKKLFGEKNKKEKKPRKKSELPAIVRGLLLCLGVALAVLGLFFILRVGTNGLFGLLYRSGHYAAGLERTLLWLNKPEGYVPWYNLGNAYFQQGEYQEAVNAYYNALSADQIPEQEECKIRINLALAILKPCRFEDLLEEETAQGVVTKLLTARQILVEKGCAHENDEKGHNAEAQQLKDEIDEILKKFASDQMPPPPSDDQQQQDGSGNEDEDSGGDGGSGSQRENQIRDKIEENKQDALEERAEERQSLRDDLDIFGEHEGSGEYQGERW